MKDEPEAPPWWVRLWRALAGTPKTPRPAPPPTPAPPVEPIPFEVLRAQVARKAVAFVRPYPPHRAPVGRSRFGGLPDLPPGVEWPSVPDHKHGPGGPLNFLAQIDLADLPWAPDGFPRRGMLLFFAQIDETMVWDQNPVRVIHDETYAGTPRQPPADLRPLEDGNNEIDRNFRAEGEPGTPVYPAWPLRAVAIETMPDGNALQHNAYHHPAYVGYHGALMQFRAEQILKATGMAPSAREPSQMPIWAAWDRAGFRLDPESGFPWVADAVVWTRRALGKHAKLVDEPGRAKLAGWRARAEALAPSAGWSAADARAFADDLNGLLGRVEPRVAKVFAHQIEAGLRQVVSRTGADPALAAAVPAAVFEALRPLHAPILRSRRADPSDGPALTWTRDDHQDVQHAQMFGHVPSTQDPMPLTSKQVCLLQLQSDRGVSLILCDMGEADFWLSPDDLAAWRLDKVVGDTRGG